MGLAEEPAVRWLLASPEPGIRYRTLTEVLARPEDDPQIQAARAAFDRGPWVRALLAGQRRDGGFGVHPYAKWTGDHWRLVSLVDLGAPAGHPRAMRAAEHVLRWLEEDPVGRDHVVAGRPRQHASMQGNALGVCSRLGLAGDDRVRGLAERLVRWQWPDGGWNCDRRPRVTRSSFHETAAAAWGLLEHARATGDRASLRAARRAGELFLSRRLFRSRRDGSVINRTWLSFRYPPYWHYDVLCGLRVLAGLSGALRDPRAGDALDLLESRRGPDGRWRTGGRHWRPTGRSNTEAVDWGLGPHPMVTFHALRALVASGRLQRHA